MSIWIRHPPPWWPNPTICVTHKPPLISPVPSITFNPTALIPNAPPAPRWHLTAAIVADLEVPFPPQLYTLTWSSDFGFSVTTIGAKETKMGFVDIDVTDLVPWFSVKLGTAPKGNVFLDLTELLLRKGLL